MKIFNRYNSSFSNFTFEDFYKWIVGLYFYRELFDFQLNVTYYVHVVNMNDDVIAVIPFTMYSPLDKQGILSSCFDLLCNNVVEYTYECGYYDGIYMYISKNIESDKINYIQIKEPSFVKYLEIGADDFVSHLNNPSFT